MTPVEVLRAVARGEPGAGAGLAPACRAQAYGAEAFGPAAIAELFARNPSPLSPSPAVVQGAGALSLLDADGEGGEQGWFADLHDGLILRLWRVGAGERDRDAEPPLAVASDVFLTQARSPVAWRPEDHPDLAAEAAPALAQVAAGVALGADPERPLAQARALVLRALSAGDRGAALLCVQGPGTPPRLALAGFRFAGDDPVHVRLVWDAVRAMEIRARL